MLRRSRKSVAIATCAFCTAASSQGLPKPNSASYASRIWADTEAANFSESYLIGNGRLGAVLAGGTSSESIALNEDSFWSGGPLDRVNPDAASHMPRIQQLVRDGQLTEAEQLASYTYFGTPYSTRNYDFLGTLTLTVDDGLGENVTGYERWLDLADSTAGTYFTRNGTAYEREFLASEPAGIIAMRLRSSAPSSFHVHFDRTEEGSLNRFEDFSERVGNDMIVMGGGSGGAEAILFATGARVVSADGVVSALGDTLICHNATEAWIFLQSWTSFRQDDPREAVVSDLQGVTETYETIRADHVADYQDFYNRTTLNLGASAEDQRQGTTLERFQGLNSSFDPELASLYFQFGRYLFISTSRAGTLPPNLQGIWNDDFDPQWGSKYTININLEMNYWPSLVTGLADLNSPLYDLISRMHERGSQVASTMYNVSGAVAHHNTDIRADCAPQDNYAGSTIWAGGLAWLTTHIMEDYRFTGNTSLIAAHLPILKDVLRFYLSFVTEDPHGWLVTNPSTSPEHSFYLPNSTTETAAITMGPQVDSSLIWELVGQALQAMEVLGDIDDEFVEELRTLRDRLPPIQINSYGGIQEWIYDYEDTEPGHRHFSQLFGLFPGSEITSANKTSFDAGRTSLNYRLDNGGGDTGWSRAWAISLAARTFQADEVHNSLVHLLTILTYPTSMLDTGPPAPFQADGNYGATAGISEALVQSHELVSASNETTFSDGHDLTPAYWGYGSEPKLPLLRLLPSLPKAWAENGGGSVLGLRARGGFVVDVAWDSDAKLVSANMTSTLGGSAWVTVGTHAVGEASKDMTGDSIRIVGGAKGRFVRVETQAGETYRVDVA